MKTTILATDITNGNNRREISIEEFSRCSLCGFDILPAHITSFFYWDDDGSYLQNTLYSLFFCPHCKQVMMRKVPITENHVGRLTERNSVTFHPHSPPCTRFSNAITTISPQFVEIYHQSEAAEAAGLNEVCGIGYRKAIEFLVKDYCCSVDPEHAENIRNEFLGQTLNRIQENRIKTLAQGAVWLGNDETHYVRKNEDRDITDMKRFIAALVHFLDSEFAFQEALGFVNGNAPSTT